MTTQISSPPAPILAKAALATSTRNITGSYTTIQTLESPAATQAGQVVRLIAYAQVTKADAFDTVDAKLNDGAADVVQTHIDANGAAGTNVGPNIVIECMFTLAAVGDTKTFTLQMRSPTAFGAMSTNQTGMLFDLVRT